MMHSPFAESLRFALRRRLPIILQTEHAECGLACLAMVSGYHGQHLPLAEMRRRFSAAAKGTTMVRLMEIAALIGLHGRPLRIELDMLKDLQTPAVLHWDMKHFVVLRKVSGDWVHIHDPLSGERSLRLAEVSRHFTGVALELTPAANFSHRTPTKSFTLGELTGPVIGIWPEIIRLLLLSVTIQALAIVAPLHLQWVVDQALLAADRSLLGVLAAGFVLLLLLQTGINAIRSWAVTHLSTTVLVQWSANVLAHLLRLPLEYFERRNLGDVLSRMGSLQSIQRTLSTMLVEAVIDGLMAIVVLSMMVMYSPVLALVTVTAIALYGVARAVLFRWVRNATELHIVAAARQSSHLIESIRGIQSIKLAGREAIRRSGWQNHLVETANRDIALARLKVGSQAINQLVFGIDRIAVITLGALLTLEGVFSVGMLIAYLAYKEQFSARASVLIERLLELRMLKLHGERLADIVLSPAEDCDGDGDVNVDLSSQEVLIEAQNVSFRYSADSPWIIRNCSLSVRTGESLAIIGPSGGGKTTLLKLLLGLLKPTEGRVLVAGHDISKRGRREFYRLLGTVMQDDQLFAGSIADNIAFFDDELRMPDIERAARLAGIHDDVRKMPMGFHTLIGDMGSALSGGQKQRLLLARALYRRPNILVLDEATSHLDVAGEHLVNRNVKQLDITKVIVAHRPETIASADRIVTLRNGCIHESSQVDIEV